MKWVFTIILLLVKTIAAQIPNGSFEEWTNGNPESWQTTNIPIVPPSILLDSDSYSGSLSVKGIVVSDVNNHPFQPYLGIYGAGAQGFPVTMTYDHFTGWFKSFLLPGDRFRAYIRLFNSNQETIAEGALNIDSSVSMWTEFDVTINYFNTEAPVSCAIFFTITDSSAISSGQIGSYFKVDGLSLASTVGISTYAIENNISVFVKHSDDAIVIKNFRNEKGFHYSVNDISGKNILRDQCDCGEVQISTASFPAGIFLLDISSEDGRLVKKIFID